MSVFEPQAIGWSATMGLIPGYGHDNDPDTLSRRRDVLVELWNEAMEACHRDTRFSISCVMTDATVLYPQAGGCPEGGERAIMLTGSSNPKYVKPHEFEAFMAAVERVVRQVQVGMEQTSCRIEFTRILRSVYSRPMDCGQCEATGTIVGGLSGDGPDEECPVCDGSGVLPG